MALVGNDAQKWHPTILSCSTKNFATSTAGSVGENMIRNPVFESLNNASTAWCLS